MPEKTELGLVLVLVLVLVAPVFADQAFVGTAPNGSLVLRPADGQQVLVDGVVFQELVEKLDRLDRLETHVQALNQQVEALKSLEHQVKELSTLQDSTFCGLRTYNSGSHDSVFGGPFDVPCGNLSVASGCPVGYSRVRFRFTANHVDSSADGFDTCVKTQ